LIRHRQHKILDSFGDDLSDANEEMNEELQSNMDESDEHPICSKEYKENYIKYLKTNYIGPIRVPAKNLDEKEKSPQKLDDSKDNIMQTSEKQEENVQNR